MFPIDFFWRAAQRWPERIAIDAPEGLTNYRTLAQDVAALAATLRDAGWGEQQQGWLAGAKRHPSSPCHEELECFHT